MTTIRSTLDKDGNWLRSPTAGVAERHAVREKWSDTRTELAGIEQAARFYLLALKNRRDSTYDAKAVARIDNHGSDFAGRVLDLLSDMHGEAQRQADEAGVAPEELAFDSGILGAEYLAWSARAAARSTVTEA